MPRLKNKTKQQLLADTIKELKESREKYRQLVKCAPAGIYEIDFLKSRFTSVNDVICEYTGYTEQELLSMNALNILTEASQKQFLKRLQQMVSGEQIPASTEFKIRRKNGGEIWTLINSSYKYQDGIPVGATVVAHDITDRKNMEKAIYKSEKKFKKQFEYLNTLIENMNELLFTYDETSAITFANKQIAGILGYLPQEVKGKKITDYISNKYKEDAEKKINSSLESGYIEYYEAGFMHKNGGEHFLRLKTSPLIENGKIKGGMVLAEDITELKKVEQEMARLDRLNIVGEMAASIGHEIRNPMTSVRGFLQFLGGKPECLKYNNYFTLMIEELDRANSIITQFLSLAKNKPVDKKMQNINDIIANVHPLIQADAFEWDKHVELSLGEIPELLLDEKEIRQLIFNLTHNGLEAMSAGGTLFLATTFRGTEVFLSIKDQGPGMCQEMLEKLGTPFVTTKEKGTGLGIAVCYRIAARHNAKISVITGSEGTTFIISFAAVSLADPTE